MRFGVIIAALAGAVLGATSSLAAVNPSVAAMDSGLIARVHSVGLSQIVADTNAAILKTLADIPETGDLEEATLQKLATAPYRFLKARINPANSNDHARTFRMMLDDSLRNETYLEMRRTTNTVPEFLLAVRLDKDKAEVWRTNLAIVLAEWTGIPVVEYRSQGFDGWELRKHDAPNRIRFIRAGDWILLGWGQDEVQLEAGMLQRIKDKKRPVDAAKNYWLDASMDWPAFASFLPPTGPFKPSKVRLTLEGRTNFIRPQLVMQFAEPLGLNLEPWRIPTNTIHSPIVSFTAVRGIGPRLSSLVQVKTLEAAPVPNQFFVWASEQIPIETCIAAAVPDSSNYLERIQPRLVSLLNSNLPAGPMKIEASWSTNHEILVRGIPVIVPYLRAIGEPAGDFLLGGLLPSPRRDKPLPVELISTVTGRANLVYYDWEITAARLQQWRGLTQLGFMAARRVAPGPESPGQKWLDAVKSMLGNCATEVTQTAPNELTLVRNSPIGLTGVELLWLVYWLDAPGFPLEADFAKPAQIPGPGFTPR